MKFLFHTLYLATLAAITTTAHQDKVRIPQSRACIPFQRSTKSSQKALLMAPNARRASTHELCHWHYPSVEHQ